MWPKLFHARTGDGAIRKISSSVRDSVVRFMQGLVGLVVSDRTCIGGWRVPVNRWPLEFCESSAVRRHGRVTAKITVPRVFTTEQNADVLPLFWLISAGQKPRETGPSPRFGRDDPGRP